MKKCQKWSGNNEFWLKNEYRQISSSFGQHALNPFDTKPMAKIAVKMSIMRVVKFMSSWDNDFTSWPKHHQLLFGGQSVELPLTYTGFPGCHQVATRGFQCEKSEVKIHSLLMFEGLWHPLVSKVAGIGSPAEVRSWDPRVLWCHAHPRCYPANTVRDSQLKLEKCQILGYGRGGTAPYDPH